MTDPFQPGSYWEDRLRANYDERGVGDIGLSKAYNTYLYAVRRRIFRRLLRRLPLTPSKTRVLDVGSGTGVYVQEWLRWGAGAVTGCDITQVAVDRLAESFRAARFLRLDIGASVSDELRGERFDVISAFDVLFHIVDDQRYRTSLERIAELVVPGGWFLYSDNLVEHESRISHFVSRTGSDIIGALTASGFIVRRRTPMFVVMNDPVRSRSRLLRRWFTILYGIASRSEPWGGAVGRLLYPVELVATRLVRRGPSTEILICQRV
ncbi:MAG: class I SAM-dependent methyltransferase [Gemmatimonadaceae bacterium]